jgi:hypothetical protein
MKALSAVWLLFMASASFWLPAYEGDLGREGMDFVPLYLVIAGLAAIGIRETARSSHEALLSTIPVIALLAVTAATGFLANAERAQERGDPLYLYFGVTLFSSWAVLVLSSALVSRTRWNGGFGIGVGCLVALIGLFMITARID